MNPIEIWWTNKWTDWLHFVYVCQPIENLCSYFLPSKGILIKLFCLTVGGWKSISDIMQFHLMNFIPIINYIWCHSTEYTTNGKCIVLSLSFWQKTNIWLHIFCFVALWTGNKCGKRKWRHSVSWKYYFSGNHWVLFTVFFLSLSLLDFYSIDFIALIGRPKIVQTKIQILL